jgi:sialate O-acetylesterase
MDSIRLFLIVMASSAGAALPALAAPELDALFQDHAVLQRDKPAPVWGRAAPGEHVSVAYAGQTLGATAGPDGRWIVAFAPMAAISSGADLTVTGNGKAIARDVVVGEVWLCSGGVNMEFEVDDAHRPLFRVNDAAVEVAAARYPLIRHFKVAPQSSARPMETLRGDWKVCSPETVGQFTAVGYFFARDLLARLNVPFGIINSTWEEAPLKSWMSPVALAGLPAFSNGHPAAGDPRLPGSAFNGMIHPLLQCAIRGAIWYQGEGDVGRAADYAVDFPRMITSWRAHFGQGDFPFFWVQLANVDSPGEGPGEPWAYLREAQSRALSLPSAGQAVAVDIGDSRNVHPGNKREVGRRLALIAKAKVYAIPVDCSGPVYREIAVEGSSIRVRFSFAGEGLTASGKPLQSFEVAGADRVFHPAGAIIQGDSVVVRSIAVGHPVAVRYAWRNAPEANLYSGAGLPAAPFRSDEW